MMLFPDIKTPIVSMHQPWCQWVERAWKTIESRQHNRWFGALVGQRIGIHRSKFWDDDWFGKARPYLTDAQVEATFEMKHEGGFVSCTALIAEHRKLTTSDAPDALVECETDRWGIVLLEVEIIPAVFMTGRQGLWRYALI